MGNGSLRYLRLGNTMRNREVDAYINTNAVVLMGYRNAAKFYTLSIYRIYMVWGFGKW